jgi:hypothetical protein
MIGFVVKLSSCAQTEKKQGWENGFDFS